LQQMFRLKCAFCESRFGTVAPFNVEHFRPKNGALDEQGKLSPDHYWWLGSEWSNLYAACVYCSKPKGSRFPVEGTRAPLRASENELRLERPLLLDPCLDHPEEELTFDAEGSVGSNTKRGQTTIKTFNLNRSELVQRRKSHVSELATHWNQVVLHTGPQGWSGAANEVRKDLQSLREFLLPDRQFLALTHQCLQLWALDLIDRLPIFRAEFSDLLKLRTTVSAEPPAKTPTKGSGPVVPMTAAGAKQQIAETIGRFKEVEKAESKFSVTKAADREKFTNPALNGQL